MHDRLTLKIGRLEVTNSDRASIINHENEEWMARPPVNETVKEVIKPHSNKDASNINHTEVKPEDDIAGKEPESGDVIEKELIQKKIGHRNLEKIDLNSELSVKLRVFNQELNNETGKCIQEIESADLKLKVNSYLSMAKSNKKNSEAVTVHEHDQDIEKSNIVNNGKGDIGYLKDNRRKISCSNYSNENCCGNLMEGKMDSRLTRRINNTETSVFAKPKNSCLLQMGLKDPIKDLNEQEYIILKDINGMKHSERI